MFRTSLPGRCRVSNTIGLVVLLVVSLVGWVAPLSGVAHAAGPCDPPIVNPVACENTKPGSPESEWQIDGQGDTSIQGFATDIGVNAGTTVHFKIKTNANAYTLNIYRVGWYGGAGARKVATFNATGPQNQPACLFDSNTNLTDCGNWAESASWAVPADAVSGVYFARIARTDTGGESHIVFVVRNDASHSALLFQTADTTWQAYNTYGGASLYPGSIGRAHKVSYNRPFDTRSTTPWGRDFLFANEYPMIRFLERNGYDTSYVSGIDVARHGNLLTNHATFLSVGHDEYWSGEQRANVEAARDAGVNLAFFSGNEVYWKTRWEPSVDGSNTSFRTMVCYKETYLDADDPQSPPTWTGTWRDPRESPPADGGRPENALTGTGYLVNDDDLAIQVPAADGRMRFWRNTSVATLGAGETATLASHSLGYESDEDLDNGFRPAGLVQLSTTTGDVDQLLQDYGTTVAPGTTTHHMTLYRAASGALVFGAGTIQFPWGLDDSHDGATTPVDPRMQQATVNLLADMGAQPATLMAGLSAATASSDTTPPSVSITLPAAGAVVGNGSPLTVSGTAADAGGGVVGGVEVSLDGGATWHPATGRESWSYTGTFYGLGPITIQARASDDSGRLSAPVSRSLSATCPCVLFGSATAPKVAQTNDGSALELGVRFSSDVAGWVSGIRFYKSTGNTGTHTGTLWSTTGTQLATGTFTNESASGWQELVFPQAVQVTANTSYVASYYAPNGRYAGDAGFFQVSAHDAVPLHVPRDSASTPNGLFRAGTGFPTNTFKSANYWVSPVFSNVAPPDVTPPTVTSQTPLPGSSSVATSVAPSVVFNEAVQPATIGFTLVAGGQNVAGAVGYDPATRTATFTPSVQLANGTAYTATVSGVQDTAGNTLVAPAAWTFTTAQATPPPGVCPCSIWPDSAVPAVVTQNDPGAVTLGVKFRSDADGTVTGIRFYKGPENTGSHTGTLWSASGTQLATGTFSNETTAGWQTLTFATPVDITKNTTYVASYHTTVGHYSVTANGFAGAGVDTPPLHALANGVDGQNGVYIYGANAFPSNGTPHNYWVDVTMTLPPDITPPTVAARSPGDGATSVPVNAPVKVTFSEPIQQNTVAMQLTDAQNNVVPAQLTYDAQTRVATLAPNSPLVTGQTYTASVSGAQDAAGNVMSPVSWSFTASGVCPCTIFESTAVPTVADAGDTQAVELGVKFRSDVDGWVSSVRFYKAAANTGTHVGTLWATSGTQLASATFVNETATGWQQVNFSAPVPVTAGTTYVASYHAPNGHYSAIGGAFDSSVDNAPLLAPDRVTSGGNGVYAYGAGGFPNQTYNGTNYWVDVVFTTIAPPDTTPPTVTTRSPLPGATSIPVETTPRATFSEEVQPATIQMTLAANVGPVTGSVSYDPATKTATFSPAAALNPNTMYTVTVGGAKDAAGNTMASTNWGFTTADAGNPGGPFSIWSDSTVPGTVDAGDTDAVALGVKFAPSASGRILGIRFYKSEANTGPHVGTLWSSSGTALATATFVNESSAGWQEVRFATPVDVTAGTTYVASYHTTTGHYSANSGSFATSGVTNGPLTALSSPASGGNGVYAYSASSVFPTNTHNSANYWVDVVFEPST